MDDVIYDILDLLYEDYYNLWEMEVQINVERSALNQAIDDLLRMGLVEWYYRDHDSGTVEALPWSQLSMPAPMLSDASLWKGSPPEVPQVLLGLTPTGMAAIRDEYARRTPRPES
jgi:hypothetical protein